MNKITVDRNNYEKVLSKGLFNRDHYLDKEETIYTKNMIKRNRDIPVLFNDVNESPIFSEYKLIIHGITPCGSKTTVIVENIYPSVDVEYLEEISKQENTKRIQQLLSDSELLKKLKNKAPEVKGIKLVEGKKLIGFSESNSQFIRIFFKNLYHRKEFILNITKKNIQTYNNDISSYYRVVARQYKLALSGWTVLSNYSVDKDSTMYKSKYIMYVNIDNMKVMKEEESTFGYSKDLFRKDKTISMAFDIEQYSSDFDILNPNRETSIPRGDVLEDTIFNIGMTFHFINDPNSCLNLSLITVDCEPHEDYITVVCADEATILLVFSYIIKIIQPDYIYEFNGSGFDWPNIYQKAKLLNVLDDMLKNMSIKTLSNYELQDVNKDKYIYVCDFVKISADMTDQKMSNIRLQGYIAFDLRIIFMQLNPTESKSSLKFYLSLYKLGSKDDMPIKKLFKFFYEKDYVGLGEVAHYCYVDCFRLHQLAHKNNIIQDKRAVGLLSYTSLFDAFYRANSCKVRNLIVSHALDKNLFYNSIKKEEKEEDKMDGKYPGALVLNPKRGLVNPIMNFEEFCKQMGLEDKTIIEKGQEIIDNNFDAIYIQKDASLIKY
jgi:DNA polymerase elongation subunit (family B)